MNPFLSVVVPCYKTASTMRETIDSILEQGPLAEVVVVNDGSPDNTREIAESYGDRIRYFEKENGGVAPARNFGLEHASGEFTLFLDADDKLLPDMAAAFKAVAEAHPEADVLYSDVVIADDDMKPKTTIHTKGIGDEPLADLLRQNRLLPQGTIVRTSLLKKVGGLDPSLSGVDDWDLWVRLAAERAKFEKVDAALSVWRFRTGSQSKQFFHTWGGHRAFFRKHRALYDLYTTKAQQWALISHIMDRDLPHLYGDDLGQPWLKRRLNRIGKFFQIVAKAPDLVPVMARRLFGKVRH